MNLTALLHRYNLGISMLYEVVQSTLQKFHKNSCIILVRYFYVAFYYRPVWHGGYRFAFF